MPSSPQVVTVRGVFDYLYNSAGKAIVGATVNCTLNFNGASVTSPIVNVGELQQATVTDQNGFWRFNLVPNDTLTPTGTLYTIVAPNASYDISVPSGVADIQSSSILANTPSVLSPAATNLTGPITVTGNETVTGNLTVSGTTTLGSTTTGALTTAAETVGGDLTIGSAFRLLFGAAAAKIIPGATSISHRNNADNADNLLITDAGAVTVRNGLTVTAGGETVTAGDLVVTAGRLLVSAAAAKILGGATSLSLRNNADNADNVLVADAGAVTLRNAISLPPSAGGTLAATSYGSVPVKIAENLLGSAVASVTFSSIPQGFRHLELVAQARGDAAAFRINSVLTLNGDAGTNYIMQVLFGTNNTATSTQNTATGPPICGDFPGASGTASYSGILVMRFVNYTLTTFVKNVLTQGMVTDANAAADQFIVQRGIHWTGTGGNPAAITSIQIATSSGNFIIGSLFTLYGIP